MIDTNKIRRRLLRLTRKYTDERLAKFSEDVMDLCDAYDEQNSMERLIAAGEQSLDHSFGMIEKLRKSL
jgi:hypothetical protein